MINFEEIFDSFSSPIKITSILEKGKLKEKIKEKYAMIQVITQTHDLSHQNHHPRMIKMLSLLLKMVMMTTKMSNFYRTQSY